MQDFSNLKKALSGILEDTKKKKADEEAVRLKRNEEDRAGILRTLGKDLGGVLQPYIDELKNSSKMSVEEMSRIIAESVKIDAPSVDTAPIQEAIYRAISGVKVNSPVVNYTPPVINIPKIEMPTEMGIKGWISMMGYDKGFLSDPLPVQLRDAKGNPIDLSALKTSVVSGGGSGKADFFTIKGFSQSAYSDVTNADGRLRVSVETGGSGLTDNELRASSVPVEQVSGSIWSVVVVSGAGATSGVNVVDSSGIAYSGSNPLPVAVISGASATTAVQNLNGDGLYRGTFPVEGTVAVSGVTGSIGATILDGDGLMKATWLVSDVTASVKASLIDSSGVGYSGSNPVPVTMVTGVSASVNATIIDSAGNYRDTFPIQGTVDVSGITASTQSALIDSSGVQYSGTNPVPVILVAGSVSSTVVVGPTVSDSQDDNSAPVKVGGIARTANPTAVSGGDAVSFTADDLGRQITRPVQVRDLIATAYVAKTTGSTFGTETTLLSATAGKMFDLIYVMGCNDSDAAISCDIRGVTAGNILMTIRIPANGTAGVATPVPIPQTTADTGNAWTIDLPDVTGTNVTLSALFSNEI